MAKAHNREKSHLECRWLATALVPRGARAAKNFLMGGFGSGRDLAGGFV